MQAKLNVKMPWRLPAMLAALISAAPSNGAKMDGKI